MILPLTDSSDESSIDQNPTTTTRTKKTTPTADPSSIVPTTMSFEEDGSVVVVDLTTTTTTEDVENVRPVGGDSNKHGARNCPASRSDHKIIATTSYPPPKRTRNHRWLTVAIGMTLFLCFGVGIYFYLKSKRTSMSSSSNQSSGSGDGENILTQQELALHSDPSSDCWILIDDIVYDVTQYAPTHPGGPEYVTDFCGRNSTKDYYLQHPQEYLALYLSADTRMGVISTNTSSSSSTTDNTDKNTVNTDNKNKNENDNSTSTVTDEKDDKDEAEIDDNVKESDEDEDDDTDDDDDDDDDTDDATTTTTPSPINTSTDPPAATTAAPDCISLDEVVLHSSVTDCYYILYDYVYDFTNYMDLHPGGARKVFQECGTDATAVYITEKHHDEALLLEVNAIELYGLGYAC